MQKNSHQTAKGTLYLTIAQVVLLGSGYIIHFGLARMVSVEQYGRFGIILAILVIVQYFVIKGVPDAVAKFVAEGRDVESIKKKGMKIQLYLSLILYIILFITAPLIAQILNDEALTMYIWLGSLLIIGRAFLSIYNGILNGLKKYSKSSKVLIIYHILRVTFVFTLVLLGFEIFGVIMGYILALFIATLFAYKYSKTKLRGTDISTKDILSFSYPMVIFTFSYILIMNLDILFVANITNNSNDVAYFTAASTIAGVAYTILMALSFTIYPSISKSIKQGDMEQTKSYINYFTRYAFMILLPLSVIVYKTSEDIITLFYPGEYIAGSEALGILIFGISFISMFIIFASIINTAGDSKPSMIVGLCLIPISIVTNYILINKYGMAGGAMATTITGFIGMIAIGLIAKSIFKTLIPFSSLIKICSASGIVYVILNFFPASGIIILMVDVLVFIGYFGILYLFGEFKKEDFDIIKGSLDIKNKK